MGAALLLTACSREGSSPDSSGFELRIAHLTDLAWQDRAKTGQPTEFMPPDRYSALLADLSSSSAHLLVLRGIGSEAALEKLRQDLLHQGGNLKAATYVKGPTPYAGIGFLSQHTPAELISLSDQSYEIEGKLHRPMAGGIQLIEEKRNPVWIWNASLPDPGEPYERRRNEARLLAQALRPLIQEGQAILLSLHCREETQSPMIRMLTDIGLVRIHAEDEKGDTWTHRDPDGRVYLQDQLLFASPGLAGSLPRPPRIHESPELRRAGEFRHQRVWLP